jgi:hypothetical protein
MFKKILQSLSKSQAAKPAAAPVSKPAEAIKAGAPVPKAGKASTTPAAAAQTPEELCEIGPKMPKDQIHSRLKLLYRRYNRSASSLDPKIRGEADSMLDAIVRVREKHFGEI